MTQCRVCNQYFCDFPRAHNDNHPSDARPGTIIIPSAKILGRPSSVRRLAMAYRATNLPRRKILDVVAQHLYLYDGVILYEGQPVWFDDVDMIFGTDRDPSERWLSDFLSYSAQPPRQQAQGRVEARLLLLWAALAVHSPEQAAHILA